MKILKIELQNINSLKSNTPIVIDFENEVFRDVGLFAITGPTGAGKTTILDAITIALYHSVPRFKNTSGALVNVISHGATEAFSRVVFENDQVIYEAYWGMRLISKTGKELTNPSEEVSFKNLTTEVTISTMKTTVKQAVVEATQLDYEQFLRSVLLAQGQFASFLSAKGPEKGKLLEQITGEEIYKKIGQGILDRKSREDVKLKEIQSKINAEDILTDEQKTALTQKDSVLDIQIIALENEMNSTQKIVNWYESFNKLTGQAEKIEIESKEAVEDFEKHKFQFALLDLNEKAEPFKDLIQNLNRNEKSSHEQTGQLAELERQLASLQPEIDNLTVIYEANFIELKSAKQEMVDWSPKFDLITKLDGELKNERINQQKSKEKLTELDLQIGKLELDKQGTITTLQGVDEKIVTDESFVQQKKFLTTVSSEVSSWTADLTTLKTNKETLSENSKSLEQQKSQLEETKLELVDNKRVLDKSLGENQELEKDFNELKDLLTENNLPDLYARKEKVSVAETKWKQLKLYAAELVRKEIELQETTAKEKAFSSELVEINDKISALDIEIKLHESTVIDAEKILELEKSIAKYEDDRQNLVDGQACGLCGSTEHPFTENLTTKGTSVAELELKNRKEVLTTLVTSKAELEIKKASQHTRIESLKQLIAVVEQEIIQIQQKAKELDATCELSNTAKIEIEINSSGSNLKALEDKIAVAIQLQKNHEELSNNLKLQSKVFDELKTKVTTLEEKIRSANREIDSKEKAVADLTKRCADLEQDLTMKLAKFNYQVPSVEQTNFFIQDLEKTILFYNATQKNLDALKADKNLLKNTLLNVEKQLEEHLDSQKELNKQINEAESTITEIGNKRAAILSLDISVEQKRTQLQNAIESWTEKSEVNEKERKLLSDLKIQKEVLKIENKKRQTTLNSELKTLQLELDTKLTASDFESKTAIENALLTYEDKQKYTQNKKRIEDQLLRLQTLKETVINDLTLLNTSKDFDTSEEESKTLYELNKVKRDGFTAEKGEVREAFRKDQEIQDRNQDVYKEIDAQNAVCKIWRDLFKIIGNSKDAFNTYVQRLTLKHLLDLANVHLFSLNKRYSLQLNDGYKTGEELDFSLIDHYQTDQVRLVETSSGGERFIISLALALGLSDLASKNVKIDSLFIDEGFGTLDKNTLETVISTLETLQTQGKMIGIISHVENLKERIPTQIQITKKSNGVSVLEMSS